MWKVYRHSGRYQTDWRVAKECDTEELARKWYNSMVESLRAGRIKLVNPDGVIVDEAWAPWLRTRW